jgi:hypothetical protein
MTRTVKYGRNLACYADAASRVLIELALTGLGYNNFWHFVLSFPCFGHGKTAVSF